MARRTRLSMLSSPPVMPSSSKSALLGRAAPEFRRPTVQGSELDTHRLKGRVWVAEFFAEFCAPCQRRLPFGVARYVSRVLHDALIVPTTRL